MGDLQPVIDLGKRCEVLRFLDKIAKPGDDQYDRKAVIGAGVQISKAATKFGLMFKSKVPLNQAQELCAETRKFIEVLAFSALPSSLSGANYRQEICKVTNAVLSSVQLLCQGIADPDTAKDQYNALVGGVWEACKRIPKAPLSAVQALLVVCKDVTPLITDAKHELLEGDNDFGDDDDDVDGDNDDDDDNDDDSPDADARAQSIAAMLDSTNEVVQECITYCNANRDARDTDVNVAKVDALAKCAWAISEAADELVNGYAFEDDDLDQYVDDLKKQLSAFVRDLVATPLDTEPREALQKIADRFNPIIDDMAISSS